MSQYTEKLAKMASGIDALANIALRGSWQQKQQIIQALNASGIVQIPNFSNETDYNRWVNPNLLDLFAGAGEQFNRATEGRTAGRNPQPIGDYTGIANEFSKWNQVFGNQNLRTILPQNLYQDNSLTSALTEPVQINRVISAFDSTNAERARMGLNQLTQQQYQSRQLGGQGLGQDGTFQVSATQTTTPINSNAGKVNQGFNIQFRSGLSTVQQQSIQQLTQKPISQWTQTDRNNWNYATNNSPLPSGQTYVVQTGNQNNTNLTPQQIQGLNAAYSRYQNGTANTTDMQNLQYAQSLGWNPPTTQTNQSGQSGQSGSASSNQQNQNNKTGSTDTNNQAALKKIDDAIKSGQITASIGELWKQVVQNYPTGSSINPQEIINTLGQISQNTIDPYFQQLTNLAIKDVQASVDYMNQVNAVNLEKQQAESQQRLQNEQAGLESRGKTFSGEAVQQLGQSSALRGVQSEGYIPQYNRLLSQSNAAQVRQGWQSLGLQAEQKLGSGLGGISVPQYNVLGGVTGLIEEARQQAKGQTLQNLINNQLIKNQMLTNKSFNINPYGSY